jgi:FkbM family methyltransferase
MVISDLVFDIGCHVGHDTAYYLHCGFRVVAVDANPELVTQVGARFASDVQAERLTLLNVGIAATAGEFDLWLSASDSGSSSLFKHEVSDPIGSLKVQTLPFPNLLQRFGVPFYLKVDIQGAERLCLDGLDPADLPRFLSWEAGPDAVQSLEWVRKLGYRGFKCIEQLSFRRMSDRFSLYRRSVQKLRSVLGAPPGPLAKPGWTFTPGHSSGPFGEETDGKWCSYDQIRAQWEAWCERFPDPQRRPSWCDFHAKL